MKIHKSFVLTPLHPIIATGDEKRFESYSAKNGNPDG